MVSHRRLPLLSSALLLAALSSLPSPSLALNNGLALTPPCGLNSYMAGKSGAAFLQSIADFFGATGMNASCFKFVNTDEGWELSTRDPVTQRLRWDPNQYPMGVPNFTASLAAQGGYKFGLYGAASGVTCGGISGQLGYEDLDVDTFISWGVGLLKSDNCASYAMDSSVRFAATRDALLRANADIVYSIEPFAITPNLRQSARVANYWRIGKDISGSYPDVLDRASISDKWAPLAGPGAWNDPDMINVGTHLSDAENRAYFGLWCIIKAPLLLSADLPALPASIQATITNPEVVAINQDPLGVQARKLLVDGSPVPFLVGFERCDAGAGGGTAGLRARSFPGANAVSDTRVWATEPHASVANASLLVNSATGRCLSAGAASGLTDIAVLLPCNATDALQAWTYGPNARTVATLVNAGTGLALAASNSTLFSSPHGDDPYPSPDAAYGAVSAVLQAPSPTQPCGNRDCQGYTPAQLWYGPDLQDGFIAQATFTASINHCFDGDCYELTKKPPTFALNCLAHVLSVRNGGTDGGQTEVWGGPLAGGSWVLALLNAGSPANATIAAPFSAFEVPGVGAATSFCVRDVWARANLGVFTGSFSATVAPHDVGIYRLTPGAC
jgi:hypothetical protein